MPSISISTVVSFPFSENTYLIHQQDEKECVVIDPGLEPEKIFSALTKQNLNPVAILLTHGHSDHIGGNEALREKWPEIPILVGELDAPKLTDPNLNLSGNFGLPLLSPAADRVLNEGDDLELAGIPLEILYTPGHCIGHLSYLIKDDQKLHVISGDVLFQESIGRTDFPDGSFEQLKHSIHEKLFKLPPDSIIYPGHGLTTTIGHEIENNPYIGKPAGYRPVASR